ncbi:MAG: DUF2334 domain-containing protein [Gaiellales bacterium]|nr:MAG: DUF2334 domain-containing protein [Gaiellales bacterium]
MLTYALAVTLAFLLLGGTARAYEHRALLLVDEQAGEALDSQELLTDLLGHFGLPADVMALDSYQPGDIERYRVTFYLGSVWDRELPPAFLADVMTTRNRFVWINHNIWKLEWSEYELAFQDRFGFTFIETRSTESHDRVSYQGQSFWRPQGEFGQAQVLDPGKAEVLAAVTTASGSGGSFPYVIRSGDFFYVADDPLYRVTEESDYLVFADLLHEMVGIDHADEHRALVRIEDVDPTEDPARIRAIADYLHGEGVPFSLAVIPRFEDPLGTRGAPVSLGLSDRPELVSALKYAVTKGGTIVLHGYTHQYGSVANPYNGVTGLDSEFYIQRLGAGGDPVNVSPVPEDSIAWVNGRIDSALAELNGVGIAAPLIWETPHYLASDLDNQVFAARFGVVYQRFADSFFPYIIQRSSYGSRVIPENLGYIQPGVSEPSLLIERAGGNLVVRDGFASFFYHSELDLAYLRATVAGLKAKGYTFVGAGSLAAAEPRDVTPPAIGSVSPAGVIYADAATVEVTYSDAGDGIDMIPVSVTLDGAVLANCSVGPARVSCPVTGLSAGGHSIGGLVPDNAGNVRAISGGFTVGDNTPPQVSYAGPGGDLGSGSVTITAGYSDPGLSLGIDAGSARVRLNGGDAHACDAAAGVIECRLAGLADGSYAAEVAISDNAGNHASATGSFSVDTTAPVVSGPLPAGWVVTTQPVITARVLEANLHEYPAWLQLDGRAPVACAVAGTVVSCPAGGLSQGTHGFRIDVYDRALNRGSAWGEFSVDTEAPVVTVSSPVGLVESTDVKVEAGLDDRVSGVDAASVRAFVDGAPVDCAVSAAGVSCQVDGLRNGEHTLRIDAADRAGNSRSRESYFRTLYCTGAAPSLELAIGGPFWASYADYQGRLLSVDYFVNNPSGPDASNVVVARSDSTNGVSLEGVSAHRFSIPAGGRVYIIIRYGVPQGVGSFRTETSVTATDDCGNLFIYPDPRSVR